MVLRELFIKIGFDVDAKGLSQAENSLKRFTEKVTDSVYQAAVNAVRALDDALIGFNARSEQARMGLAGIAGMNLKLPWEEAKKAADELYAGLQADAAKTPAETSELVDFAQEIAGAYLQAGKNMKDLRQFTTQAVVAAKMLRAEGTAATDIKQAIQGRVGVKDMFASNVIKSIGMTNEQFNAKTMKERADLFAKGLNNPTIRAAMEEYEGQWDGVTSTIKDNVAIILGEIGKPLFAFFKKHLIELGKWVIKNKDAFEKWGKVIITDLVAITSLIGGVVKLIAVSWVEGFNRMGTAGKVAIGGIAVLLVGLLSPFTAIVAAVSAIMLLFDDIRGYFAGEDSLTGDFVDFVKSWFEPKADDSWFVAEIKKFLLILNEASKEVFEFGKKAVSQFKSIADVVKLLPPVLLARLAIKASGEIGDLGGKLRQVAADAAYTVKNPDAASSIAAREAVMRGPRPEVRGSGGVLPPGGGVLMSSPTINIGPVTQLPGESGQEFADRVGQIFEEKWSGVLEPVMPGVSW
jgi:hypothetical protein